MKTLLKLTFNAIAALFLGLVIASFMAVSPIVVAGVIFITGIALSFVGQKEVAYVAAQANIFGESQLQFREIALTAIYLHYGWKFNAETGKWEQKDGRPIPKFLEKVTAKRHDFYHNRYLTIGDSSFDFFDVAQSAEKPFDSNFGELTLSGSKMYLIVGIQAEVATGASAADTAEILDFGAAATTEGEVLNGLVNYECNGKKILENQPFKNLFVNDDAVKNFLRLPQIIVWEPNEKQKLNLKLAKAYPALTYKYTKMSLVGYMLE